MRKATVTLSIVVGLVCYSAAEAVDVTVTVENLNPAGGIYLAPTWVGFHDGSFDAFDVGSLASPGIKRQAEDGPPDILGTEFAAAVPGGLDGVIVDLPGVSSPPAFDPGNSQSMVFNVNPLTQRYFNFTAMVVPSNDAFAGNDAPIELFDVGGNFIGPIVITVDGNHIWDAGTEQNTELDAGFINQAAAGDGIDTSEVISVHPGYIGSVGNPGGTPIILGNLNAAGEISDTVLADFTRSGGTVPQFRITVVPEPMSMALLGGSLIPLIIRRRRKATA